MMAVRRFGVFVGLWMTAKRVLRCHPFCAGGYDPVPEARLSLREKDNFSMEVNKLRNDG